MTRWSLGGFEFALTVLGTVVSHQGNTVVLDVGRKSVGIDFVEPGPGTSRRWEGAATTLKSTV